VDGLAAYSDVKKQPQADLITKHASMVKRIAHHLMCRLPQSVMLDDLIQAGMLGLLEAARNYDDSKGASFETYAGIRIRGHMLDEVRRNDWVPRSVYKNARMISEAVKIIENRYGRDAKDVEVAQQLGISIAVYHQMLKDSAYGHLFGFDDLGVTDDVLKTDSANANEPFSQVQRQDFYHTLVKVIGGLPEKERLVLSLYYEKELNLKEIGKVLGVSESRISQIHSQAMHRIKSRLPDE
jgi:RNA polymerase sigma factor FliA